MIYSAYMPLNNERDDEWTESAENEPEADERERIKDMVGKAISDWIKQPDEPADWPDEPGDEQCKGEGMLDWTERTQLVKPLGKCVELDNNGIVWQV